MGGVFSVRSKVLPQQWRKWGVLKITWRGRKTSSTQDVLVVFSRTALLLPGRRRGEMKRGGGVAFSLQSFGQLLERRSLSLGHAANGLSALDKNRTAQQHFIHVTVTHKVGDGPTG